MSNLDRHNKFIRRLDSSRPSTFRVAEWLHKKGYDVYVPAIKYCPPDGDPEDYFDGGDLFARKNGKKLRFEVKHSGYNFTCAEDWPVKDKTMIVSNKAAVERENGKAAAFIIVNKSMDHVALIWRKTRKHWFEKPIFATNTQKYEDFYCVAVEHVDFRDMVDG